MTLHPIVVTNKLTLELTLQSKRIERTVFHVWVDQRAKMADDGRFGGFWQVLANVEENYHDDLSLSYRSTLEEQEREQGTEDRRKRKGREGEKNRGRRRQLEFSICRRDFASGMGHRSRGILLKRRDRWTSWLVLRLPSTLPHLLSLSSPAFFSSRAVSLPLSTAMLRSVCIIARYRRLCRADRLVRFKPSNVHALWSWRFFEPGYETRSELFVAVEQCLT